MVTPFSDLALLSQQHSYSIGKVSKKQKPRYASGDIHACGHDVFMRRVNMLLDAFMVEYFKAKAGERGYQTLINAALAEYICRQALADTLRRVIREELQRTARLA
jgi:uncharacterized protein (DUF4415 family)